MKKIYVGNLPWSVGDAELEELFAPLGAVESAKVITDRDTGRSRGFGFVEMDDEAGDKAIAELNGKEMEGRQLRINEANERRSPAENQRVALTRLRINLAIEVRSQIDPCKVTSQLWQSRCRGGRIVVSPKHDDFPAILAEALDVLSHQQMDVKDAADTLGCTPSQLLKLLKAKPRALTQVNNRRTELGLHCLK